MRSKPLISVIIPVYNVDKYIGESIESVIAQDIGFKDSTELIIVDDGSSDRSLEVAQKYESLYPDNIIVRHQENGGVSSARNLGLKIASGKYIHFFDGDDLLTSDYHRKSIEFLEAGDVDFVASKIKFFDKVINSHPLNYKFSSTRVIDLKIDPENPIAHLVTCVFKREALVDVEFDTRLSIAEDMKLISDILMNKQAYGVLNGPVYFYRKRVDDSSAIASGRRNKKYYLPVVDYAYGSMISNWSKAGVSTLPMEYTILYDLSYRLCQESQDALSSKEQDMYKKRVVALTKSCNTEAIAGSRFLTVQQKMYILKSKYGDSFSEKISYSNTAVYVDGFKVVDLNFEIHLDFIDRISDSEDKYRVEGYVKDFTALDNARYFIDISGVQTELQFKSRKQLEESFLGDVYQTGGAFSVEVEIPEDSLVTFIVQLNDKCYVAGIEAGRFTLMGASTKSYRRDRGRIFQKNSKAIRSMKYYIHRHVRLELLMLVYILFDWRIDTVSERLGRLLDYNLKQLSIKDKLKELSKPWFFTVESICKIPETLALRLGFYVYGLFKKRPIWIISDRPNMAGDNGEALYRHIYKQEKVPAKVYFAVSKKSSDYKRVRDIGRVLPMGSFKYKLIFLLSDVIISSHADADTTNPFIRQIDRYVDLMGFSFVFLQHGVTKDDLSGWLNRFSKNIQLLIVSSKKEYDMFLSDPYYYDKTNILMSGMPRYDLLLNNPKKKLILAPTYRKNLISGYPDKDGNFKYNPQFIKSDYRNFYNNLINDKRITKKLADTGMTGEFYIHPMFSSQVSDFDENNIFKIARPPYDYKSAFRDGEMLITDHSSVVFDFAYLKKPVIYAHFDMDSFFEGHSYSRSDSFTDERDGFGEVCYDYESLVSSIVTAIKNGCVMSEEYKKRVDSFFAFVDQDNSKRVYDAIIHLDK